MRKLTAANVCDSEWAALVLSSGAVEPDWVRKIAMARAAAWALAGLMTAFFAGVALVIV